MCWQEWNCLLLWWNCFTTSSVWPDSWGAISVYIMFLLWQWNVTTFSGQPSDLSQIGFKSPIVFLPELQIWWAISKHNRAPLLCYVKLCALSQSHWWIQTGVTVRKCLIPVKIGHFLFRVTLKFGRWPWQTIGHLFYAKSRFMHHCLAISELKLELVSGNAQFGWKSAIPFLRVTFQNFTDDLVKQ